MPAVRQRLPHRSDPGPGNDATPELVARIRELFGPAYDTSGFPNTRPYPWVPGWLANLRARGCGLYVATNKRWRPLEALRTRLGWEDVFDGWYAFDMYEGRRLKKSELLAHVMETRGIDPADAVMVGDTAGDVVAGKAAGMYTIGCTWGYGSRDELEGADEIYDAERFAQGVSMDIDSSQKIETVG